MLRDFNMEWLEKRVWIPYSLGPLAEVTTPTVFRTWTSGTSITAQIAASTVTKLATSVTNDGGTALVLAPYDLDIKKQIRFRVFYLSTATSGTVTWQIRYLPLIAFQAGTAGATVIAAPTSVLDTPIPAASGTVVANDFRVTDFGIINRNTLPDTTDALIIETRTTDAGPIAGLGIVGVEMRYTPRKMAGPRRNVLGGRRLTTSRPLSTILATAQEGL